MFSVTINSLGRTNQCSIDLALLIYKKLNQTMRQKYGTASVWLSIKHRGWVNKKFPNNKFISKLFFNVTDNTIISAHHPYITTQLLVLPHCHSSQFHRFHGGFGLIFNLAKQYQIFIFSFHNNHVSSTEKRRSKLFVIPKFTVHVV